MKKFKFAAIIENIEPLTDEVNAELEENGCGMKVTTQIDVAIDELFGNIARYAYGDHVGEAEVILDFTESPRAVRLTFIDGGVPFDPLMRANPDVTLSAEERGIGGLGIFVVKKMMDNIEYSYSNGKNILTIEKRIG